MLQYFPNITGSLTVTGSVLISGSLTATQGITISGSIASASYAETLQGLGSASFAPAGTFNTVSSSFASTSASLSTRVTNNESTGSTLTSASASFATMSGSLSTRVTKIENNYATTGSNAFNGSQNITGSLTVSQAVIAQTLNVQQVTSSIVYSSGSNVFGNQLTDVQQMTGSLRVTGSGNHFIQGGSVAIGTNSPNAKLEVSGAVMVSSADAVAVANRGALDFNSGNTRLLSFGANPSTNGGFQFITLASNGTGNPAMTITGSTGNVGLGTSNPTNLLHASSSLPRVIVDTTSRYAAFNTYVNGVEKGAFYWDNDDNVLRVQAVNVSLNHGGSAGNIGLYVSASGNVGIGTTTPTSISTYRTLEIYGSTGAGIRLWNGSTPLNIQQDGTNAYINNVANGNLYLYTNDTPRLIITSSGNVIAGPDGASSTSKITSYLGSSQISGTNDGIRLQVQSYNTLARNTIVWGQNGSNLNLGRFGLEWDSSTSLMNFVWRDIYSGSAAGSTELMRLRGDGNVGIGTSSPSTLLQVSPGASYANHPTIQVVSSYADGYDAILSLNNTHTGGRNWQLRSTNNSQGSFGGGKLIFQDFSAGSSTYVMALTGSNVGIGTLSPTFVLTVAQNKSADLTNVSFDNTAGAPTDAGTQGTILRLRAASSDNVVRTMGAIASYAMKSTGAGINNNGDLRFYTGAEGDTVERMRVASTGYLRLAGYGIQFNNDTADANSLDDYEEGTWTPVVKVGTTTNTATNTQGVYTKIGRVVYIQATITSITKSGTGNLSVEGLPFTVGSSATFGDIQATLRWDEITSDGVIYPYFVANNTKIDMQDYSNTGYTGNINNADLSATYSLYGISGFYMV